MYKERDIILAYEHLKKRKSVSLWLSQVIVVEHLYLIPFSLTNNTEKLVINQYNHFSNCISIRQLPNQYLKRNKMNILTQRNKSIGGNGVPYITAEVYFYYTQRFIRVPVEVLIVRGLLAQSITIYSFLSESQLRWINSKMSLQV